MTDIKKKLLNLCSEKSAALMELIPDGLIEVVSSESDLTDLRYIIIDDTKISEIKKYNKHIENGQCKVLLLSETKEFVSQFGLGVRFIAKSDFLKNDFNKILIERFFKNDSGLFVEENFSEDKTVKNVKLSSQLSFGYYADVVSIDAFEQGFSPVSVRSYFISVSTYFAYLNKTKIAIYPFEVNFGLYNEIFFIEINASVQNFYLDYLLESLKQENKDDVDNLLYHALRFPTSVEISYNKNSKKINIVAAWMKGEAKNKLISINEINSHNQVKNSLQEIKYKIELVTKPSVQTQIELETKEIPGKGITRLELREGNLLSNPLLLKRLIGYCSTKLEKENKMDAIPSLAVEDVEILLNDYPDNKVISDLDILDKETILKGLQNSEFSKVIQGSLEIADDDVGGKEKLAEDVISRIGGVTDEKIEEIIKIAGGTMEKELVTKVSGGGPEDLTEENTLVKGGPQEKESVTVVKGGNEDKEKESVTVVKGDSGVKEKESVTIIKGGSSGNDQKGAFNVKIGNWAAKKDEVITEIRKKFSDMIRLNMPMERMENALVSIVMTKMEMGESGAKIVVAGLMEEAKASLMSAKATDNIRKNSLDPLALEKELKNVSRKAELDLKSRDEQIIRMKGLMDKLNNEVSRLREKSISGSSSVDSPAGNINLGKSEKMENAEINKLQNDLLDKDIQFSKYKKIVEENEKNKNKLIDELKNKIETLNKRNDLPTIEKNEKLKEVMVNSSQITDINKATDVINIMQAELINYSKELDTVQTNFERLKKLSEASLKIKNDKIIELESKIKNVANKDKKGQIEERREDQKREEILKREADVLKRQQNLEAHELKELQREADRAKKLEIINKELEKRITANSALVTKLQNELMQVDTGDQLSLKHEIEDQKTKIDQLKKDLLLSESKVKQSELESKRSEHKISTLEARLKLLEKNNTGANAKGQNRVSEVHDGKLAVKVKQLEAINSKLTETNKKTLDELGVKKSELLKLKQENIQMKNQLTELEKKSSAAKKAS